MSETLPRPAADAAATDWAREGPCGTGDRLRAHLQTVHETAAGFTEACASACRDREGRNSYDWLLDAAPARAGLRLLDLACGSGVLLELCRARLPADAALTGVDMSAAELALARTRLDGRGVELREGVAQSLAFAPDGAFDAVLCHWALTLMDPLKPALAEIARVLAPGGAFAAVVDGPGALAPSYDAVSAVIAEHVRAARPDYAELGDPRARDGGALQALVRRALPDAAVSVEAQVFSMSDAPDRLADSAAGFYYSAFVLDADQRAAMLGELAALFAAQPEPRFDMPVSRLVARRA